MDSFFFSAQRCCTFMWYRTRQWICSHVTPLWDKHTLFVYLYIMTNSTKGSRAYKEINSLWVRCGFLNDSDSSVFANLGYICKDKKIFNWKREETRKKNAEHNSLVAKPLVSDSCTRAQVSLVLSHIPPSLKTAGALVNTSPPPPSASCSSGSWLEPRRQESVTEITF